MRETDYAYAVARVRAHESRLLTRADLDRLLTAADEAECRRILADRGYPARGTAAEMLSASKDPEVGELARQILAAAKELEE